MDLNDCTPSHAQSIRLKKLSQEGSLDSQIIYGVMSEEKPNQKEQIKFKRDDFKSIFRRIIPTSKCEKIYWKAWSF